MTGKLMRMITFLLITENVTSVIHPKNILSQIKEIK